jgi:hypothetical protein
VCRRCAAVIVDDDEGANRAEHVAFHAVVDGLVAGLGLVSERLPEVTE